MGAKRLKREGGGGERQKRKYTTGRLLLATNAPSWKLTFLISELRGIYEYYAVATMLDV